MNRRKPLFAVVALLLLTTITYLPALRGGFIWDDDMHLTQNPAVTSPEGLRAIWTSFVLPVYYPLTFSAFWLMYQMWGANPFPYHVVTLGLHAVNVVLLFFVLRQLGVRPAWMIAAVWAAHPANVESVAWITELKNTLSGVFFFATLLCFLKSEGLVASACSSVSCGIPAGTIDPATVVRRNFYRAWYAMALLCGAAAMLSKSSTVVLPAVLLLCAWWQRGRLAHSDVMRTVPFFALSLAASVVAINVQVKEKLLYKDSVRDWSLTWAERLIIAGKDLWFYTGKIVWPTNFAFIYPRWTHDDVALGEWLPLVGVIMIGVLLWRWRRLNWCRAVMFGLGYFVITLSPVLGFFDQYFYQYSFVADHFQYLASIGVIALVVAGATVVFQHHVFQWIAAVAALAALGALSWGHCDIFREHETLWRDTLVKNPRAVIAYVNMGALLNAQQQYEEAIRYHQEALRLKPGAVEPHCNMGVALTALERYEEALNHFQEALRSRPDFVPAHYRLGVLYGKMNRLNEAEQQLLTTIQYSPPIPEAFFNLGVIWERQGKRDRAPKAYRDALRIKPDYAAAHNNLANLLAEEGKLDEAIDHYRQAVATDPKLETAHRNLGILLQRTGDINGAIEHLRLAVELQPARADSRLELGQALISVRRYAEAMNTFQSAMEVQEQNVVLENALAWLLATCPEAQLRDGKKAVQTGERAVELTDRKLPQVLDTLAAAYAETGRFDDATVTAREALVIAHSNNDTNLASEIAGRIKLYERRQPYHLGME